MSYFIFTFIHAFLKLSKGYFPCILSDSDGVRNFINLFWLCIGERGVSAGDDVSLGHCLFGCYPVEYIISPSNG